MAARDAGSCRLTTAGDAGDKRLLVMRAAVGEPNSGVTGTSCSPLPEREFWNRLLVMGDKDNILQLRESRAYREGGVAILLAVSPNHRASLNSVTMHKLLNMH